MDKLNVKCSKCGKTMQLSVETLLPYSGKLVKITCRNPECKTQQKLQVPVFKKNNTETVIESAPTIIETNIENVNQTGANKKAILLVLQNSKTEAQSFSIDNGIYTIGRLVNKPGVYVPDIAIRTQDTYISKKHCQITVVTNNKGTKEYILKDAGSTNGTFFNSTVKALDKNDEVFLNHADTILLGDTHLVFELR